MVRTHPRHADGTKSDHDRLMTFANMQGFRAAPSRAAPSRPNLVGTALGLAPIVYPPDHRCVTPIVPVPDPVHQPYSRMMMEGGYPRGFLDRTASLDAQSNQPILTRSLGELPLVRSESPFLSVENRIWLHFDSADSVGSIISNPAPHSQRLPAIQSRSPTSTFMSLSSAAKSMSPSAGRAKEVQDAKLRVAMGTQETLRRDCVETQEVDEWMALMTMAKKLSRAAASNGKGIGSVHLNKVSRSGNEDAQQQFGVEYEQMVEQLGLQHGNQMYDDAVLIRATQRIVQVDEERMVWEQEIAKIAKECKKIKLQAAAEEEDHQHWKATVAQDTNVEKNRLRDELLQFESVYQKYVLMESEVERTRESQRAKAEAKRALTETLQRQREWEEENARAAAWNAAAAPYKQMLESRELLERMHVEQAEAEDRVPLSKLLDYFRMQRTCEVFEQSRRSQFIVAEAKERQAILHAHKVHSQASAIREVAQLVVKLSKQEALERMQAAIQEQEDFYALRSSERRSRAILVLDLNPKGTS